MEVKIDSSYVRSQRERRAWSQEHLAAATGLGLRTIQRIEKTGAASYESARSLAAVFGVDVAELRVAEPPAPKPRRGGRVAMRPALGALAVAATAGALFFASSSSADQVLVDFSVAVDSSQESRAVATRFIVDDGALVADVNDLKLGNLRFSIVPRVRDGGRVLLEVGVYEQRGDEEVVVAEPRLVAVNGEQAAVVIDTGDSRTLRLQITPQVNPPVMPPTLRAR